MVRLLEVKCIVLVLFVTLVSPFVLAFTALPSRTTILRTIPREYGDSSSSSSSSSYTLQTITTTTTTTTTSLLMVGGLKVGKKYEPKWKKKETLADKQGGNGPTDFKEIGLKGNIPVVFRMGNETKTTMAFAGQPIKDVASQSGQFIKYGCGKGECGTCEALCGGQWIRPCTAVVPADLDPSLEYVIQVKESKAKKTSSGKFYSIKSFFMGFWNNLLGMVGFLLTRRQTKRNFDERMDFEDMVLKLAKEKRAAKAKAAADLKP